MEDRNDLQQILSDIDTALTRCTRRPGPQLLHADKWVAADSPRRETEIWIPLHTPENK